MQIENTNVKTHIFSPQNANDHYPVEIIAFQVLKIRKCVHFGLLYRLHHGYEIALTNYSKV